MQPSHCFSSFILSLELGIFNLPFKSKLLLIGLNLDILHGLLELIGLPTVLSLLGPEFFGDGHARVLHILELFHLLLQLVGLLSSLPELLSLAAICFNCLHDFLLIQLLLFKHILLYLEEFLFVQRV